MNAAVGCRRSVVCHLPSAVCNQMLKKAVQEIPAHEL